MKSISPRELKCSHQSDAVWRSIRLLQVIGQHQTAYSKTAVVNREVSDYCECNCEDPKHVDTELVGIRCDILRETGIIEMFRGAC